MRNSFLVLFLVLFSASSFAADVGQIMDVPDSEPMEEVLPSPEVNVGKPQAGKEDADPSKKDSDNKPVESNVAVLRGLNKVIGRVSNLEVPLGTVARFENLEIIVRKCWKSPPEERPENAILLEVREIKVDEAPKQIFLGWMFSSSPSISGIEHPVYDITAISCEFRKDIEVN